MFRLVLDEQLIRQTKQQRAALRPCVNFYIFFFHFYRPLWIFDEETIAVVNESMTPLSSLSFKIISQKRTNE